MIISLRQGRDPNASNRPVRQRNSG